MLGIQDLILHVSNSSVKDLILNVLNTIREQQTQQMTSFSQCICTLSWLGVAAPSNTESSVHRFESQGSRPFAQKSLWPLPSVISSAPNESVLYWEPTRWMEPLHHCCTGAQWEHCTACLFDSQPHPHCASPWLPSGQCRL